MESLARRRKMRELKMRRERAASAASSPSTATAATAAATAVAPATVNGGNNVVLGYSVASSPTVGGFGNGMHSRSSTLTSSLSLGTVGASPGRGGSPSAEAAAMMAAAYVAAAASGYAKNFDRVGGEGSVGSGLSVESFQSQHSASKIRSHKNALHPSATRTEQRARRRRNKVRHHLEQHQEQNHHQRELEAGAGKMYQQVTTTPHHQQQHEALYKQNLPNSSHTGNSNSARETRSKLGQSDPPGQDADTAPAGHRRVSYDSVSSHLVGNKVKRTVHDRSRQTKQRSPKEQHHSTSKVIKGGGGVGNGKENRGHQPLRHHYGQHGYSHDETGKNRGIAHNVVLLRHEQHSILKTNSVLSASDAENETSICRGGMAAELEAEKCETPERLIEIQKRILPPSQRDGIGGFHQRLPECPRETRENSRATEGAVEGNGVIFRQKMPLTPLRNVPGCNQSEFECIESDDKQDQRQQRDLLLQRAQERHKKTDERLYRQLKKQQQETQADEQENEHLQQGREHVPFSSSLSAISASHSVAVQRSEHRNGNAGADQSRCIESTDSSSLDSFFSSGPEASVGITNESAPIVSREEEEKGGKSEEGTNCANCGEGCCCGEARTYSRVVDKAASQSKQCQNSMYMSTTWSGSSGDDAESFSGAAGRGTPGKFRPRPSTKSNSELGDHSRQREVGNVNTKQEGNGDRNAEGNVVHRKTVSSLSLSSCEDGVVGMGVLHAVAEPPLASDDFDGGSHLDAANNATEPVATVMQVQKFQKPPPSPLSSLNPTSSTGTAPTSGGTPAGGESSSSNSAATPVGVHVLTSPPQYPTQQKQSGAYSKGAGSAATSLFSDQSSYLSSSSSDRTIDSSIFIDAEDDARTEDGSAEAFHKKAGDQTEGKKLDPTLRRSPVSLDQNQSTKPVSDLSRPVLRRKESNESATTHPMRQHAATHHQRRAMSLDDADAAASYSSSSTEGQAVTNEANVALHMQHVEGDGNSNGIIPESDKANNLMALTAITSSDVSFGNFFTKSSQGEQDDQPLLVNQIDGNKRENGSSSSASIRASSVIASGEEPSKRNEKESRCSCSSSASSSCSSSSPSFSSSITSRSSASVSSDSSTTEGDIVEDDEEQEGGDDFRCLNVTKTRSTETSNRSSSHQQHGSSSPRLSPGAATKGFTPSPPQQQQQQSWHGGSGKLRLANRLKRSGSDSNVCIPRGESFGSYGSQYTFEKAEGRGRRLHRRYRSDAEVQDLWLRRQSTGSGSGGRTSGCYSGFITPRSDLKPHCREQRQLQEDDPSRWVDAPGGETGAPPPPVGEVVIDTSALTRKRNRHSRSKSMNCLNILVGNNQDTFHCEAARGDAGKQMQTRHHRRRSSLDSPFVGARVDGTHEGTPSYRRMRASSWSGPGHFGACEAEKDDNDNTNNTDNPLVATLASYGDKNKDSVDREQDAKSKASRSDRGNTETALLSLEPKATGLTCANMFFMGNTQTSVGGGTDLTRNRNAGTRIRDGVLIAWRKSTLWWQKKTRRCVRESRSARAIDRSDIPPFYRGMIAGTFLTATFTALFDPMARAGIRTSSSLFAIRTDVPAPLKDYPHRVLLPFLSFVLCQKWTASLCFMYLIQILEFLAWTLITLETSGNDGFSVQNMDHPLCFILLGGAGVLWGMTFVKLSGFPCLWDKIYLPLIMGPQIGEVGSGINESQFDDLEQLNKGDRNVDHLRSTDKKAQLLHQHELQCCQSRRCFHVFAKVSLLSIVVFCYTIGCIIFFLLLQGKELIKNDNSMDINQGFFLPAQSMYTMFSSLGVLFGLHSTWIIAHNSYLSPDSFSGAWSPSFDMIFPCVYELALVVMTHGLAWNLLADKISESIALRHLIMIACSVLAAWLVSCSKGSTATIEVNHVEALSQDDQEKVRAGRCFFVILSKMLLAVGALLCCIWSRPGMNFVSE